MAKEREAKKVPVALRNRKLCHVILCLGDPSCHMHH